MLDKINKHFVCQGGKSDKCEHCISKKNYEKYNSNSLEEKTKLKLIEIIPSICKQSNSAFYFTDNKNNQMKQYHDLLKEVLEEGEIQFNKRTNISCKALPGIQLKFDLREGFPALTTRKMPFKNILGELLGFFRGYTSAKDFRNIGCNFWTANANETKSWLDNPFRKGEDDLGRIYSSQWTDWESTKLIKSNETSEDQYRYLTAKGYRHVEDFFLKDKNNKSSMYYIMQKRINQLEELVKGIITNPSDRRLIVTGWNPGEMDFQSLPACHMSYKFIPFEDSKVMHVIMDLRSMDLFLGTPANIISTAIFLEIVCRFTGYTPGTVTIQGANAHIYETHEKAVKELLEKEHYNSPELAISNNIKKIENIKEVSGCFRLIEPSDIWMNEYVSHEVLTAPMAV